MEIIINKIHVTSRAAVAFVLFYHGLVSKIIFLDDTERAITDVHKISLPTEVSLIIFGAFEILLALILFFYRKSLLPVYVTVVIMVLLLIDVVIFVPELLVQAFSPVTMNIVCIALCFIIIISSSPSKKYRSSVY